MPKKGHTDEQILAALHQVEAGAAVAEVSRKLGVSTARFTCGATSIPGSG